jgi:hypothetical protein
VSVGVLIECAEWIVLGRGGGGLILGHGHADSRKKANQKCKRSHCSPPQQRYATLAEKFQQLEDIRNPESRHRTIVSPFG